MSGLTIRQHRFLGYVIAKDAARHERGRLLRPQATRRARGVPRPAAVVFSAPTLLRHIESGAGVALLLIVGLAFLALAAAGGFR